MAVSQEIKNVITKEKLEHLKNVQVLSRQQIAVMFGVGESTIKRLLSEYGIKSVHNPNRSIKSIDTTKPLVDYNPNTIKKIPELAERLVKETSLLDNVVDISLPHRYHFLKNGMTEIPKCLCGKDVKADKEYTSKVFSAFCSAECSRKWSKNTKKSYGTLNDKEHLKKLRFDDGLSFEDMAKQLGANTNKIIEQFTFFELDTSSRTWADSPRKEIVSKKMVESRGNRFHGKEKYSKLINKEYMEGLWKSGKTFKEIGKLLDVNPWVVSDMFTNLGIEYDPTRWIAEGTSIAEKEVKSYIEEIYSGEIVGSYRVSYCESELDIYLPDKKIGIEFNGCYYHSEKYKDKSYHKKKLDYWYSKGIRMISIWEDDWDNNNERVKSFLRNLLGKNLLRIGARKCKVVSLSFQEYHSFLEENHMLGGENSGIRLGLMFENKLVSVMGFKKESNNGRYNLTRFSNINVNGAFTKLISHFIKTYSPTEIISLADLEIVDRDNNIYSNNNFIVDSILPPDYLYFNRLSGLLEHKFGWRKKNFASMGYDITNKTEQQLAEEANLLKCWDCGKIRYKLIC